MNIDANAETSVEQEASDQSLLPPEVEVSPESSAGSGENHEQETNGVQERINKITAQKYEEKRRADELQRQLDEIKSQKAPEQQVNSDLSPPSLPDDLYDEEAMRKYHAETLEYNRKVAQTAAASTFESQQKARQEQEAQKRQSEVVQTYANNAIRDGVDLAKLESAEKALQSAGLKAELGNYLLSDPNGGKIVEYLADNPTEMYKVLGMDPVTAGIHIATQVKPKALSTTPSVSSAPSPIPDVKGGGTVEVDEFDKKYPGAEFI